VTSWEKYAGSAEGWSEEQYADARAYLTHRAALIRSLGPALQDGDSVLDLACGDGGLADFLTGLRYVGVDASEEMVAAGTARRRTLVHADLNDYEPPAPVFARIRSYTERKLVFDLNPRQYRLEDMRAELHAAGFTRLDTRPFFVPQTRSVPLLTHLERSGPLARLLLRYRFTLLCAAS